MTLWPKRLYNTELFGVEDNYMRPKQRRRGFESLNWPWGGGQLRKERVGWDCFRPEMGCLGTV